MKNLLEYLKYVGIYFLLVIVIALLSSLFNLMGISSSNVAVILNLITIFILSIFAVQNTEEKGIVRGLKLGITFVILMFLINLIIFKSEIILKQFIYYIILIISATLGGGVGKNIKIKNIFKKRNLRK